MNLYVRLEFVLVVKYLLNLQLITGDMANSVVPRILQGSEYTAVLGTTVAFTCVVAADFSETRLVKWIFNDVVVMRCDPHILNPASVLSGRGCTLTISPVEFSSEGVYRCSVFDDKTVVIDNLQLTVVVPNSTIDLTDLSTGNLVDSTSVCIHSDSERTFQCTVRQTQVAVRNFTWIFGGSKEEFSLNDVIPSPSRRPGKLVDVNSLYVVSKWPEEARAVNLTCRSSGYGENTLSVTVQLRSCSDINECGEDSTNNCDTNAECVNSFDGFQCMCNDGFTGDGSLGSCKDTNECEDDSKSNCDVNAACVNSVGSFSCTCNDGFTGNGTMGSCLDVNECEEDSTNNCDANAECVNSVGSFRCTCNDGFTGDGTRGSCQGTTLVGYSNNTVLILVAVISAMGTLLVVGGAVYVAKFKESCRSGRSTRSVVAVAAPVEMEVAARETSTLLVARPFEDRTPRQDVASVMYQEDSFPAWAAKWELLWSNLVLTDTILGRGNFGEVRSGAVRVEEKMIRSAIKTLKANASRDEKDDFMDEFRTMTAVGYHPNIVSLFGACRHQDVLYVALEYLPHGDLRSYLRTARLQSDSDEDAVSSSQLVKFALDVAHGMEHIAASRVIHRDLAARNILLGDGLVAKVSDFGLSRGEDIYVQTSARRVPIRWLAIESVRDQTYTTQSDVWSFGILLWEIATLGGTPYPSIQSEYIAATLRRGYRMPKPDNCDSEVYALMRQCWEEDPDSRPSFADLVSILTEMTNSKIKHTYLTAVRSNYGNLSVIRPEFDDN